MSDSSGDNRPPFSFDQLLNFYFCDSKEKLTSLHVNQQKKKREFNDQKNSDSILRIPRLVLESVRYVKKKTEDEGHGD